MPDSFRTSASELAQRRLAAQVGRRLAALARRWLAAQVGHSSGTAPGQPVAAEWGVNPIPEEPP